MKKLLLLAALLVPAGLGAQSRGGCYSLGSTLDFDKPENKADLYLVPVGKDEVSLCLKLYAGDGQVLVYDTDMQGIPVENNIVRYYFPDEDIDYSLVINLSPLGLDGQPLVGAVSVREVVENAPPYNVDASPDGIYYKDEATFTDQAGYMYRLTEEENACTLILGGNYDGKVSVPSTARDNGGRVVPVMGVDRTAFQDSRTVTEVVLADPANQQIAPGALWFTSVPYDWEKLPVPRFCYPNGDFSRFVCPVFSDEVVDRPLPFYWMIFKQNKTMVVPSGDFHADESRRCGRADFDFGRIQGLYYDAIQPDRSLFRGYESYEVEALIAAPRFAAFHMFPSFSRWKYPEAEQEARADVVREVARRYGREVLYSRRVGWLRGEPGELDLVEFKHKNNEAMIVFVWQSNGEVFATCSKTTEVAEGDAGFSVWNVDDEGRYGIPNLVSIALDPDGRVILFLSKDSPESVTCYILRQVGDKLEWIDADQWYRFVD